MPLPGEAGLLLASRPPKSGGPPAPGVVGGAGGTGEVGTRFGIDCTGPYGICTVNVLGVLDFICCDRLKKGKQSWLGNP